MSCFVSKYLTGWIKQFALVGLCTLSLNAVAADVDDQDLNAVDANSGELALELETLKQQVLNLNRDLFILEEDLLFPASTQVSVFVSVDVGQFFSIDSVELKLNDKNIAGFLYTKRQRLALEQGGIQRLFVGNVKMGEHQLTALFTGKDKNGRDTKKAVNYEFEKDDEALMLELKVSDNTLSNQADVLVEEWVL